jgi:alpha-tubulin suppressor-like RCC1 family protein
VGGFTDWCQVSAGGFHSLGVRTNGTLWAWGQNTYWQLGNCANSTQCSPVSVVGGFTDWCRASAGRCLSIALRTNGTAWVWGANSQRTSPTSVVGGFTDWCQVSSNMHATHIFALRSQRKGF